MIAEADRESRRVKGLRCVADTQLTRRDRGMAEKEQPVQRDVTRVQFTHRTDEYEHFQRSKGLDSPRGPRPPVVSANPSTTGTAQGNGSGQAGATAQSSSTVQQDGGPLNYDG
jgi:hypothetical protein